MTTNELVDQSTDVVTPDSTPVELEATSVDQADSTPADDFDSEGHEETEIVGAEPSGAQKRIKQLAAQRKQEQEARISAERELAYYRGMMEARGDNKPQDVKPHQEKPLVAPSIDDYATYDEWLADKDTYLLQLAEQRAVQKMQEQQRAMQEANVQNTYLKRIQEASISDPTIAQIASDRTLPVSQAMATLIQHSDVSPQILKWLNNNRSEAARIAQLPPMLAAHELGMVTAAIKNSPRPASPKRVSAAPDPIQTLKPSTPSTVDDDSLPMEEYYRRRTKQLYGR